MAKMTLVVSGVTLLLALLLGFATAGLAVREGMMDEVIVRFPPRTRYQLILRIGDDAMPWDMRGRSQAAINLWAHANGTDWHIVNLLRVPLGERPERT